ncbi:ribonuclease H [Senna tora]|uniref:Ribonuclease H n=1 Tax=Senna tora TaxID=362788 RepID=A0A834TMQ1_9FABA|nr:ribonuclease H [Senna tora]
MASYEANLNVNCLLALTVQCNNELVDGKKYLVAKSNSMPDVGRDDDLLVIIDEDDVAKGVETKLLTLMGKLEDMLKRNDKKEAIVGGFDGVTILKTTKSNSEVMVHEVERGRIINEGEVRNPNDEIVETMSMIEGKMEEERIGEKSRTKGRYKKKMDVIQRAFSEIESEAIRSIPNGARRRKDRWMWTLTTNGTFSVKSAYHALHAKNHPTPSTIQHDRVWRKIWKLDVLPSTRVFLWRAIREILPTCTALANRGMNVDTKCVLCNCDDESCIHALIGCDSLGDFWQKTELPFMTEWQEGLNFMEWFDLALTQWSDRETELFAIAAQRLWFRRNKARLDGSAESLDHVWEGVLNTWLMVNNREDEKSTQSTFMDPSSSSVRWHPPDWRTIKINVDASCRSNGEQQIGCVMRNDDERFNGYVQESGNRGNN